MADETEYGLARCLCGANLDRRRLRERPDDGRIGMNSGMIPAAAASSGGMKQPGIGKERSGNGIEDDVDIRNTCLSGPGL